MNNNNGHLKAGNLVRDVTLISLLGMTSSVFAKDVGYFMTLGSPNVMDTNANQVTFHIDFAEPILNLTMQDFQLFNGSGDAVITSLIPPSDGSNLYNLNVTTGSTGTRIAAYTKNNETVTDADGEVVMLRFTGLLPTYIIDKTPPNAPIVLGPKYSLDQDPMIKGTAEPGTDLTVANTAGNQSCSVRVSPEGDWECQLNPDLPLGNTTLAVTAVDKVGNVSDTTQHDFTVLTGAGDEDNDGLSNADEITIGTDPLLSDTDNDGVNDLTEVGDINSPSKTPGEELIDALNPNNDSDGDGLDNSQEMTFGSDPLVVDTDGDGLSDSTEFLLDNFSPTSADSDNNGINDGLEDSDNDGINNSQEQTLGTNPASSDTDNDGVSDGLEDNDSDGLSNALELALGSNPTSSDSDGDGVADGDEDHDGDGLPSLLELSLGLDPSKPDTDGDGILDGLEDNDNDGLSNQLEAQLGLNPTKSDTDGDGISDFDEDTDNDGLTNGTEIRLGLDPGNPDTDGDGNIDSVDLDWDNDGINNEDEAPSDILIDNDKDGVPVYLDDNDEDATILDEDGKIHFHFDRDGDGILNQLDPDDDDDGISTKSESGTIDSDSDGIPNYLEANNRDSDGDGANDYLDSNDEDDNLSTSSEIGSEGYLKLSDVDKDGIPDYLDGDQLNVANTPDGSGDSDRNGISDKQECSTGVACPDLDLDGVSDYLDEDDDGDGMSDIDEIGGDPENPLDSDNNGVPDYREKSVAINPRSLGSEDSVDTVLKGGGTSPHWLMLLIPFVWFRRLYTNKK